MYEYGSIDNSRLDILLEDNENTYQDELTKLNNGLKLVLSENEMITEHNEKLITENLRLKQTIKWIKGQYDIDFTEDEIQQLEPRDKCIYEEVEKVINRFERKG